MQVLIFCELRLKMPFHTPNCLWSKIAEGVVRCWPPRNSFLLLRVVTSLPLLAKIDKKMWPWEWGQRQTEFITCSMLYAISVKTANGDMSKPQNHKKVMLISITSPECTVACYSYCWCPVWISQCRMATECSWGGQMYKCQIFSGFCTPKIINIGRFWQNYF